MKTKVLFILGGAAWLGIIAGLVINNYGNSQQALAYEAWKQVQVTKQVSQDEQAKDAANKQTIQSLQVQVKNTARDKSDACKALSQVQAQLTSYRINMSVPMPESCK